MLDHEGTNAVYYDTCDFPKFCNILFASWYHIYTDILQWFNDIFEHLILTFNYYFLLTPHYKKEMKELTLTSILVLYQ